MNTFIRFCDDIKCIIVLGFLYAYLQVYNVKGDGLCKSITLAWYGLFTVLTRSLGIYSTNDHLHHLFRHVHVTHFCESLFSYHETDETRFFKKKIKWSHIFRKLLRICHMKFLKYFYYIFWIASFLLTCINCTYNWGLWDNSVQAQSTLTEPSLSYWLTEPSPPMHSQTQPLLHSQTLPHHPCTHRPSPSSTHRPCPNHPLTDPAPSCTHRPSLPLSTLYTHLPKF